jgi:hypothetical protein
MVIFSMGFLSLLQGCSAIQLGYNNGAAFIHTYISTQIDLEPEQSALLKDKLKSLIAWHRANELPLIAKQLKDIESVMLTPVSAPQRITAIQVAELNKAFQGTLSRSVEQIAPALAELLLTLNLDQVKSLQESIEESNETYREKWMPASKSKRLQAASEGMEKRLERWYGRLGSEQKLLIQEWANSRPDDADQKYAIRLEQQKVFMKLANLAANRHISQTELSAELIKWVHNWQTKRELNKGLKTMADQDSTVQLVVDVSNLANTKQRKQAAERAAGWAEDFTQLANRK